LLSLKVVEVFPHKHPDTHIQRIVLKRSKRRTESEKMTVLPLKHGAKFQVVEFDAPSEPQIDIKVIKFSKQSIRILVFKMKRRKCVTFLD